MTILQSLLLHLPDKWNFIQDGKFPLGDHSDVREHLRHLVAILEINIREESIPTVRAVVS